MIQQNTIDIPIYNQTLILAYGTADEYSSWITKTFGAEDVPHAGTTARTIEITGKNQRELILWINSNSIKSFDVDYHEIVSHEIIHVVGFIMDYSIVKYDVDNDEPWAYLTGYVNKKLFESMKKYLK